MWILVTLIAVLFSKIDAAGLLDIRLKSAHNQKATVILSNDVNPTYLVLPIKLVKGEETSFEDLFINFNETYKVTIELDETEELGLAKSVFRGKITPVLGTSSPKKLNLPLTGVRFDFKCEKNWTGEKCDLLSGHEIEGSGAELLENSNSLNDLELEVDYTMNTQKLDTIVGMLKKENEISNSFAEENLEVERLLEQEEIMEASGDGSGEK
ncbi:hypothetical protein CRE_13716 [Caenorhabditis remanei]|uniref:Uncharacterized protein n=1 Tax=Caenorhabditis remanei TaxID=31234 RepID=E3NBR0_CAERE|nr:hypothetical protein CRE_13716 [Caenorhabditis remanei]